MLVGDRVQLDCSTGSAAKAELKKRLCGRKGVIVKTWSPETLGITDDPGNYQVKFFADGRKKEVVVELHKSILVKLADESGKDD